MTIKSIDRLCCDNRIELLDCAAAAASVLPRAGSAHHTMAGGGGESNSAGVGSAMHVVMLPWLAFGHISPFAQLARRLAASAAVRVTFLTAAGNVPRVEAMLASSAAASGGAVTVAPLRLPSVPGLPEGAASTAELSAGGAELLKAALDGARDQVAALLAELRPDAVLIDFATPWVCDIAAPLGIKTLHFSVFSTVSGAYNVVPARCLRGARPSTRELMRAPAGFPEDSPVATIPAYQAADFSYVFTSFDGQPCVYDRVVAGIKRCDGIVMKTCAEMEGRYMSYLAAQFGKPVLVAGPLVPDPPQGELEERWASWLSSFPDNAVVFASFGSETFLSVAAATELLLGLEATNRPFLAVLNFPKGGHGRGAPGPRPAGVRGAGERAGRGAHGVGAAAAHPAPPGRGVLREPRRVQLRRGGARRRLPAGAAAHEGRPVPQRGAVRARAPRGSRGAPPG
ncbi:hypothetical protein BS78_05G045200 [Paspalum vaginatum]|nr:hypothetical protein BS78_05G045200 [Paspalum vaginatum]